MHAFEAALKAGKTSTAEATAIFDSLEPVPVEFMFGLWEGGEFPTDHPMDGLLTATGWYGKRFGDAEAGDPLLFRTTDDKGFFVANAREVMSRVDQRVRMCQYREEVETDQPQSRLRMLEFRGKSSATMIYDELPILDHFRKVDNDRVLGAMDLRGVAQTYFFILSRVRA